MQHATINTEAKTKFSPSHRKEGKCYFESVIAVIPARYGNETGFNAIDVRLYGSGSVWTCAVWVRLSDTNGKVMSGTGKAGGGGYHKPSAAFADACRNAGITLKDDVGGRGDGAIIDAVKAIAVAAGYPGALVLRIHP